jgi:hypothetical protein
VTEHQALDDLIDVGPLVWGNRVFQTQIVPAVPIIEEDLAEAVVAGGITWSSRRRPVQSIPSAVCCWTVGLQVGRGDATSIGFRGIKRDSGRVSRAVSFSCAKSTLDYNISAILEL